MAKGIFVSAVGTGQGKTWLAAEWLRQASQEGIAADALKPVLSGFGPGSDAHLLLAALGRGEDALDSMCRYRLQAPLSPDQAAAREGIKLRLNAVTEWTQARMETKPEAFWLVEGAGGIASPITSDGLNIDLAQRLGLPVLLVARCYLGTLSHALTAAEMVSARGLRCGILLNTFGPEDVSVEETAASLRRFLPGGVSLLGMFDSTGISPEWFQKTISFAQGEEDVGSIQA